MTRPITIVVLSLAANVQTILDEADRLAAARGFNIFNTKRRKFPAKRLGNLRVRCHPDDAAAIMALAFALIRRDGGRFA